MQEIPHSELIINPDGSIFHLHLRPDEIADTVILVGDPGRVDTVAKYFDSIEVQKSNREFISKTGYVGSRRLTVLSTGIGVGNIDIVMTELDALVNVDFSTRTVKQERRSLRILRLGTSGALQPDIPVGSILMSDISAGTDGLLNFYAEREKVCIGELERAFVKHTEWNSQLPTPYFVPAAKLFTELFGNEILHGITISAPGFYGPQGRVVRLGLHDAEMLAKIESFEFNGQRISNFEMESSAIAGLSLLLGHQAATICAIITNRHLRNVEADYQFIVKQMIEKAIEKLSAKFTIDN
ncbi:MAG: nucleoside phosphorylase [Prevotellaceae bacterium]|jgi:uridine phosphorylase|nr:nucleoside phosphorylase [Prevotellaceae bacterium]